MSLRRSHEEAVRRRGWIAHAGLRVDLAELPPPASSGPHASDDPRDYQFAVVGDGGRVRRAFAE